MQNFENEAFKPQYCNQIARKNLLVLAAELVGL